MQKGNTVIHDKLLPEYDLEKLPVRRLGPRRKRFSSLAVKRERVTDALTRFERMKDTSAAGIDSEILVQQEYRNLSGFLLVGGHPANPLFGEGERFQRAYKEPHAIGRPQTIEPDFIPDRVAYGLVKEIYTSFGLSEESIPLFDENHKFVP